MADISKIKLPNGDEYNFKDATARANSGVTGVKGNAESSYRTGNVNLTAANVGATSASILPNDAGEIKTKYRVALRGYTGSGSPTWYFPLAKLPLDNPRNAASLIISGRIGGFQSSNLSYINALVWNRNATGIALIDIAGSATAMSGIWNVCDIVVYTNDDTTDSIYLKVSGYYTFDLDLELYQSTASFLYDGEHLTTEPTGTLQAQASTSTRRVELVNGKLVVGGIEAKLTDTTYTGTSPISINSSKQVGIATASTSAYGATKLSTATNSTATDLAATPSAVKTAYDLANDANTIAGQALSGVNGNLIYDHTFTISNGIATFTPHVYQKGVEVTTNYAVSCFTWKYRKIDGTEIGLTTKNDRGCDVTITSMGYGGHVVGIFTPA